MVLIYGLKGGEIDGMTTKKKVTQGEKLKRLIKENGYTQEQFSNRIGIGLTQLKECLNGKKDFFSLPYEVLLKMAKVLEVDLGYLLDTSIFPYWKWNSLYGGIGMLKDISISSNPENENQVCIKYKDMEWNTDMTTLENKVREILIFTIISESQK